VLVAVQLWMHLGAPDGLRTTTNAQTIAALAYVSNWYAIIADVGYWGADVDATPLTHLWSLAVEEQFYLAWPLVLIAVLALTRLRRVVAAVAGVGAVASYLACAALFGTGGTDRAYLGTDARAGALLLGVLCALALTRSRPGPDGSWDRLLPLPALTAAQGVFVLAAGTLTVLWTVARIDAAWLYRGGLCGAGVSAAFVICYVVTVPGSVAARLLGSRPLVLIGRLSYSLYLWHWPVHIYASHRWTRLDRPVMLAGEVVLTFGLSVLSFALVEEPARRVRRVAVLAPPLLACAVLVLGSALFFQPEPPTEEQTGVIVHGPGR
jgi:peptidoglycan/LPS O-acetylase OafA/YrhL